MHDKRNCENDNLQKLQSVMVLEAKSIVSLDFSIKIFAF